MPPAKRRKIEEMVTGGQAEDPMEETSTGEAMAQDSEAEPAHEGDAPMMEDKPSAGLMATADMLKGAKVGDTVSFKVVSIDPKTGDGSLESVSDMES